MTIKAHCLIDWIDHRFYIGSKEEIVYQICKLSIKETDESFFITFKPCRYDERTLRYVNAKDNPRNGFTKEEFYKEAMRDIFELLIKNYKFLHFVQIR